MSGARQTEAPVAEPLKVTAKQAALMFEVIATKLGVARMLVGNAASSTNEITSSGISVSDLLWSVESMLQQAGALADLAVGEGCLGSFGDWTCGPFFSEAGR